MQVIITGADWGLLEPQPLPPAVKLVGPLRAGPSQAAAALQPPELAAHVAAAEHGVAVIAFPPDYRCEGDHFRGVISKHARLEVGAHQDGSIPFGRCVPWAQLTPRPAALLPSCPLPACCRAQAATARAAGCG